MYFWIYRDRINQFRWRLYTANHRVIADSGEGYFNLADCIHGINLVKATDAQTPVLRAPGA